MNTPKRKSEFAASRREPAPEVSPPHRRRRKPPTKRSLQQELLLEQRYLRHALAMGECPTRQMMIDDAMRRIRAIEREMAEL